MGKHARALLAALDTAWNVDEVRHAAAEVFRPIPTTRHHRLRGLADSTGARVLAEIGDDRTRFAEDRRIPIEPALVDVIERYLDGGLKRHHGPRPLIEALRTTAYAIMSLLNLQLGRQ